MKQHEGMLMWAGAAAVAGLLLGAAALTIAIIAAVSPPVVLQLIATSCAVALNGGLLAGVIRRREFTFVLRPQQNHIGPGAMALFGILAVVASSVLLPSAISSLRDTSVGEVARGRAFTSIVMALLALSMVCSGLSGRLFRMWRDQQPITDPAVMTSSQHA